MSTKTARILSTTLNLVVILSMLLVGPLTPRSAQANTWTEPPDVPPGETITIFGNNVDDTPDQYWVPGETVTVLATAPDGVTIVSCPEPVVVGADGSWSCQLTLPGDPAISIGLWTYIASSLSNTEEGSFTDAPAPDGHPSVSPWTYGLPATSFTFHPDSGGENDIDPSSLNNQSDLSAYGINGTGAAGVTTQYGWKWDNPYLSGNNSQDVCVYLSSTTSGTSDPNAAEYAVCYSVITDAAGIITSEYWDAYYCPTYSTADASTGGQKCYGSATTTLPSGVDIQTAFALTLNVTEQFSGDPDLDSQVILDVYSTISLELVNICSKKSASPASDSSDCALERMPAYLKLVKVVEDGTATPADWTLYWNGLDPNDGSVLGNNTQFVPVPDGTYTLSESSVSGYEQASLVCSPIAAIGSSVTLTPGVQETCTFTNRLQMGTLIVEKTLVNNNHATNTCTDFSYTVDGGTAVPFEADCSNSQTVLVGVHNVVESGVPIAGYTTTYNNCTNVNVPAGGSATCTITNDDIAAPALSIAKTVTAVDLDTDAPFVVDAAGDMIYYSVLVTNTGNTDLTGVTVTDPLLSNLSCVWPGTAGTLLYGESVPCTGSYTVLQSDIDNNGGGDGDIDNTATADSNETGPDTDSETVPLTQVKAIDLDKTASAIDMTVVAPTERADAGDKITYSYLITNTGNVTLTSVDLADALVGWGTPVTCNAVSTLLPGGTTSCTADYFLTQADINAGERNNSAEACGAPPSGPDVCDTDITTTPITQVPELTLDKTVTETSYDSVGDILTYSYKLTNSGNVTLSAPYSVDDDKTTVACPSTPATLAPLAFVTCSATYAVTQADIDAGFVTNLAMGHAFHGETEIDSNQDSTTVNADQNPAITIDKLTNGYDGLSILVGNAISWSYKVTNAGNVTLTNVTVTDDMLANDGTVIDCGGTSPNKNIVTSLAPAVEVTCTANGTAIAGPYSNTGTASGKPPVGSNVTATDPSSYFGADPQIEIDKVTNGSDGPALMLGAAITWTYTVTNVGNVPLSNVTVTDNKVGVTPVYQSGDSNNDGILDLAETWIYEATGTVTTAMLAAGNPYTNTGTASGTYTDDEHNSRTDTETDNSSFKAYGLTELLKLTKIGANPAAVDPSMTWTFSIYAGPHGSAAPGSGSAWLGNPLASSNTSGDADGILEFSDFQLDPTKTYTICELSVPSGYSVEWKVDTDGDGIPDEIVIPSNPNQKDSVPGDIGNKCMDFGFGTSYTLPANGLLAWQVVNAYPGGEPRTPGYWKNWNRCTGGGQAANADRNGGRDKGFTLLEDILTSPGITWDDILPDSFSAVQITSCEQAVEILDQRIVTLNGKVSDGKKLASDGARTLAMHLLAAQLNAGNGACINQDVRDVMLAAETLLDKYDFDGTSTKAYLTSKSKDYAYALTLARYLDAYNNSACDFTKLPPKPALK